MWPDRVSNTEPLTYESGALPTALRGPALYKENKIDSFLAASTDFKHPRFGQTLPCMFFTSEIRKAFLDWPGCYLHTFRPSSDTQSPITFAIPNKHCTLTIFRVKGHGQVTSGNLKLIHEYLSAMKT